MKPAYLLNLRRASQLLFLALFVTLFIFANQLRFKHSPFPVDLFLRSDPLVALVTLIATRKVLWSLVAPAAVIVILTLFLGRVFCGWMCPLGTVIDITDRFLLRGWRHTHKRPEENNTHFRRWKFLLLAATLISAVFAFQWSFLLDPISLSTRTLTVFFYPISQFIWNGVLRSADDPLYRVLRLDTSAWQTPQFHYQQNWLIAGMFLIIVFLSLYQERFWCRNLCPLGALLGLLSRVSFLRHRIGSACNHCTKCELQSRMGAYEHLLVKDPEKEIHDRAECVQCFRCVTICPPRGLAIGFHSKPEEGEPLLQPPLDVGRRRLIGAMGVGASIALLGKTTAVAASPSPMRIRPPGALPEDDFLSACTRCGECMKVCPSNGLQPAWSEAGLEGLWSPVLVPKIGPCIEPCTLCGEVCPTDALRTFTFEDKRDRIKLGIAEVDKDTCIAYEYGKDCIVCAEVCSYQAVIFKDEWDRRLGRKKRVPTVDIEKCTGCGICENKCPVLPARAIRISSREERRLPHVAA